MTMTYPSYSYLSPSTLDMALQLARVLLKASEDVSTLGFGEASANSLGMGRSGDRFVATREWIGPHRETFDQLMENELDSARITVRRLESEADAWSFFWSRATNARIDRLHDEGMARHDRHMDVYAEQVLAYQEAMAEDENPGYYIGGPTPPM